MPPRAPDKQAHRKRSPSSRSSSRSSVKCLARRPFSTNCGSGWQQQRAYATGAYRLLANYNLCLNCHEVGKTAAKQADRAGAHSLRGAAPAGLDIPLDREPATIC